MATTSDTTSEVPMVAPAPPSATISKPLLMAIPGTDRMVTEQRLIVEVSKFPELYATKMKAYKDMSRKDSIWKTISYNIAEFSDHDCRKRWKSLRDRYIRERRMMREKRNEHGPEFRSAWKYYPIMSFLEPHLLDHDGRGNSSFANRQPNDAEIPAVMLNEDHSMITVDWNTDDRGHHLTQGQGSRKDLLVPPVSSPSPPPPQFPLSPSDLTEKKPVWNKKKSKPVELDSFEKECLTILSNKADPDELFLLSLAPRLQKLTEEQKSILKMDIMAAFHKAEFS